MPSFLMFFSLALAVTLSFTNLCSEAKTPYAVIAGTVHCNSTAFQDGFHETRNLASGATVEVECSDNKSNPSFRQETRTDGRGEFRVRCPFSVRKCVKRIRRCSVKLLGCTYPCCTSVSAAAAASSTAVSLKPRREGNQIFLAGIFSFIPQKQPDTCRQRANSYHIPKQSKKATESRFQDKKSSYPKRKRARLLKHSDQKFSLFPPPWFLPPNPFQPPSIFPPNPFQPPPSIFPPNPFQPPPPSIFPPNPFQPPPAPPSIFPPNPFQPPPAPPPSIIPPIFPPSQPPPSPPPSIFPPIFPPNPFQPRSPPPPPPSLFPPLPPIFPIPPFPGLNPPSPPPLPPPPPPFFSFPPFPFPPSPRNPGPPPALSTTVKKPPP